ncbi:MAG: hypothetical protein JWQ21_3409 [Herminiimonas sp.]|nr:hypothetical protein [Herminiimonas sp.]
MKEILLESELFIIKPGFPIALYFSGCLVSGALNSRWQSANHKNTEANSTPKKMGNRSFTDFLLRHNLCILKVYDMHGDYFTVSTHICLILDKPLQA